MCKKYLAIALFFISQVMCCYAQGQFESMGKNIVKGAVDELGNCLSSPDFVEGTEKLINNLLKGSSQSLKEGGEFDDLVTQAGQAGGRGLKNASHGIGQGLEESSEVLSTHAGKAFSNVFSEVSNQFKEGGEFDLAQKKILGTVGNNFNEFLDLAVYPHLLNGSIIAVGTVGGLLAAWYGIPVVTKYIERELLNPRPKLIIESSKNTLMQQFTSLFWTSQLPLDMVFSPALKEQLDDIAKVTTMINTKVKEGKTNVKYRNLMLYGPPGTGKTMFAKELAKKSGLEYAFMSGSSFSKFKDGEGIAALDELFAWAKKSKGLMIFIDEAETFLSKRENMDPQSKAYQLLNNFLNYTGERSSQFMLVFATNHKDSLDSAMYRRIDDLIEMPLPSKNQRIAALNLYKNKILLDEKQNGELFVDSVTKHLNNKAIEVIAERTKGLSYGDLEGVINTMKTDADILEPAMLNEKLINTVTNRAIKKHHAFTNGVLLGTVED